MNEEKVELLSCPFCGGKAKFYDDGHKGYIYCEACLCRTDDAYSWREESWKSKAITDWNNRVY